jgi:3',5'-cyclic-AMP phosphodiesterase
VYRLALSVYRLAPCIASSVTVQSGALAEINSMTLPPNLVLLTGDLTHSGSTQEWDELLARLSVLSVPWEAIRGNHDQAIRELVGHRTIEAGPLRLILIDSAMEVFSQVDAEWLHTQLRMHPEQPTVIAIHHPPFDTGIWWMDCVGMTGGDVFETVVRQHPQVIKVLAGHAHRLIQTNWGTCSLWVCPSTSVTIAADLDPNHHPAETAETPTFSMHAYTGRGIVSHLVPVGTAAKRAPINDPGFISFIRGVQANRVSTFN